MPGFLPSAADVHIDVALTNLSIAYMQSADNFVAAKVFPSVPVQNKTNKFFTFDKSSFLRAAGERAPYGSEAPTGGFSLSSASYSCDVWRHAMDLTQDVRVNADSAINIDRSAVEYVTQALLLKRESLWATSYFTSGIWGTDLTGGTHFAKWSDQAASDPITDVRTQVTTILGNTGILPNTLVVSRAVHDALVKHPLVLDRYKYTSSESITPQMLARLFEVDNYYIAQAVQVTSQEGLSNTTAFVMGNNALLCYVPASPGLMAPAAGYTFSWSGLTGMNGLGVRVNRIPMNWRGVGTERIEGELAMDMKVVGADLGAMFVTAV